ncbi:MAG: PD-(D/E)XK nuclease family protein [Muribaculaceae bacterium]|nr:PD-(D/E)XK nuclease family protein [Muribaculaceae bacterium]
MDAFLYGVAKVYAEKEHENLLDYCFVFPNKRSGVFFGKYLTEALGNSILLPEITTINEFVFSLSDKVEATRYEQLFMLYNIYRSVFLQKDDSQEPDAYEFDKFQFWGDMLINDFNDADKYLVNTNQLFVNVERYKEISSDYLTPEQKEVIAKYWGETIPDNDDDKFWRHFTPEGMSEDGVRKKFVKIWAKMNDIYEEFNRQLEKKGLTYSGHAYRVAADKLKNLDINSLKYKRYIFIGFNVLSTSEISIFSRLKALSCADFYWDYNFPGNDVQFNKASRFLAKYVEEFKPIYEIEESRVDRFPNIDIIGVPSNVGQVKEVGKILDYLHKSGKIENVENAIDTAVVLPDENLFVPLINSYPADFGANVNITMGYPMRFTPIAGFMKIIVSLHLRARKVKDEYTYFYEDVQNLLSHPLFKAVAGEDAEKIQKYLSDTRLFNVPASYLIQKFAKLDKVFCPVSEIKEGKEVFEYAVGLVEFLLNKVKEMPSKKLDKDFLMRYNHTLRNLRRLVEDYGIVMQENTFFHLIERAMSSDTVTFKGEPLHGLQVMGVLETRALDFKNVILTSMNERIFPRKHYKGSFIPDAMRRSYGMSTIEFQESIYAYYFYRLISRAENVFLLYDCRGKGSGSGDMSRYLYQMKYLYPQENIKFHMSQYAMTLDGEKKIEIKKDEKIMERLARFRPSYKGEHSKCLSASIIKTLVNCPLQFYLQYVAEVNAPDEINEHIDSATLGSVVHEVMENVYESGPKFVTADVLQGYIDSDTQLDRFITRAFNHYFHRFDLKYKGESDEVISAKLDTPLTGEALLVADVVKLMVKTLLEKEKEFVPFEFVAGEHKHLGVYKFGDGQEVNVVYIIDRIDRKDNVLRIVDYKTGSDEMSVVSVEALFDESNTKNTGAILQLMIYCMLFEYFEGDKMLKDSDTEIQPMIYKLRTINTKGIENIKINSKDVLNYRDYLGDKDGEIGFKSLFHKLLTDLFDPNVPFKQTENEAKCTYCKFKVICGREEKEENF